MIFILPGGIYCILSFLRIENGLEDVTDLRIDFKRALAAAEQS